jgi:hypothetical protein
MSIEEYDLGGTYRRINVFAADGDVEQVNAGEATTAAVYDDVAENGLNINIPIAVRNVLDLPPERGKLGIGRPLWGTPGTGSGMPAGGVLPGVHPGLQDTSWPFGSHSAYEGPATIDLACPLGAQGRTYPASLQALIDAGAAMYRPYLVAEIQWSGGTDYYADRIVADFIASGLRLPVGCENRVISWGEFTSRISEQEVGFTQPYKLTLEDQDGTIRGLIDSSQYDVVVKIFLLFDDASTEWPDDAGLVHVGSIDEMSYDEASFSVKISVSDRLSGSNRNIGKLAEADTFAEINHSNESRPIPAVFGVAKRVPALKVEEPWYTYLAEPVAFDGVSFTPATADILLHPVDTGITTGSDVACFVGQHKLQCRFTQSTTEDPSTVQFQSLTSLIIGRGVVLWMNGALEAVFDAQDLHPLHLGLGETHRFAQPEAPGAGERESVSRADDATYLRVGMTARLFENESPNPTEVTATVTGFFQDRPRDSHIVIQFSSGFGSSLKPGQVVEFYAPLNDGFVWQPGTKIIRGDTSRSWKYAVNMLPSQEIIAVEGYGDVRNETGHQEKGFVRFGAIDYTGPHSGEPPAMNASERVWSEDLDDSQTAATLGHDFTSIKFYQNPMSLFPQVNTDEIFVTIAGTHDGESPSSVISNPARIIQEYITSQHFMNFGAANVDTASFDHAANNCLASLKFGFAQLEIEEAWAWIQELALQCHATICVDQGKVVMVMLPNEVTTTPPFAVDETEIYEKTFQWEDQDVATLPSHVLSRVRWDWSKYGKETDDRDYIIGRNATILATYGRNVVERPLWAIGSRRHAEAENAYLTERLTKLYRYVRFKMGMRGLSLRPGDWIELSYTDGEANVLFNAEKMQVHSVTFRPAELSVEVTAKNLGRAFP